MCRKKNILSSMVLLLVFIFFQANAMPKDKKTKSPYEFKIEKKNPATSVKSQGRTGTCWCFSTISMLESELIRMGKGEIDLSEMFVVRHTYPLKAESYVRLHGNTTFGQGAYFHDVMDQIRRYGIVPEEVYTGKNIGEKKHNHSEMGSVLKAILDAVLKRGGSRLTPRWMDAFEALLDVYLGKPPEKFTYKGKSYTPKSFVSDYLGINPDDYVEFTSYTHHPFYQKCRLEVPDNWSFNSNFYNVPIEDLEKIIEYSLKNGYTVVWGGDVSNRDFSTTKTGYGIVPKKDWEEKTRAEREKKITEPVEEKEVSQELRQKYFDNFTATDDHGMHIVGLARDQKGNRFYYTKNSHGKDRKFGGYVYLSRPYVLLYGLAIMVNKNGVPPEIREKIGLK